MFDTEHRYTGASLGDQIASTLGGVSPLVAGSLAVGGGYAAVAVFVAATFVVSLVVLRLARDGASADVHQVEERALQTV
jgi:MHS family shikimate/dehydroshikimate transporter-like MFS transporter